jgi:hypothetical protein
MGDYESSWMTSNVADYVKPWVSEIDNSLDDEEPCELELQDSSN